MFTFNNNNNYTFKTILLRRRRRRTLDIVRSIRNTEKMQTVVVTDAVAIKRTNDKTTVSAKNIRIKGWMRTASAKDVVSLKREGRRNDDDTISLLGRKLGLMFMIDLILNININIFNLILYTRL